MIVLANGWPPDIVANMATFLDGSVCRRGDCTWIKTKAKLRELIADKGEKEMDVGTIHQITDDDGQTVLALIVARPPRKVTFKTRGLSNRGPWRKARTTWTLKQFRERKQG